MLSIVVANQSVAESLAQGKGGLEGGGFLVDVPFDEKTPPFRCVIGTAQWYWENPHHLRPVVLAFVEPVSMKFSDARGCHRITELHDVRTQPNARGIRQ